MALLNSTLISLKAINYLSVPTARTLAEVNQGTLGEEEDEEEEDGVFPGDLRLATVER